MLRLFYVSTAAATLTDESIAEIVQLSAANNARFQITGALVYNGMNFGQVLEGPQAAVSAVMEKIRADTRHTGVIIVAEREVEQRAFPDWAMHRIHGLNFHELFHAMTKF